MPNAASKKESDPARTRILLVEDNAGDVYLLEKALKGRRLNYELIRYSDGEQAIRALEKDDCLVPDLIILDLNLPRRGGFDVLQTVRSRPAMVGIPVAILTSSDAAKDRHRIALTGVERYIHKPPMLDDFLNEVGRAIEDMLENR